MNPFPCPLCGAGHSHDYHRDRLRSYRRCPACDLIFVPAGERLPAVAEKAHYDLHENDPGDPGYRRFLSRLATPLLARLPRGATGLDFGCGPGPALADMMVQSGMHMSLYDVFYRPDEQVWQQHYDFITCTEVVEHLHSPGSELERLFAVLKPGGWLGIMTKRVREHTAFAKWHYIRDPTHVCFFSAISLDWAAKKWNACLALPDTDVALFRKHISGILPDQSNLQ